MICQRAEALLSAFHDGELDPGQRREVEGHLRGCNQCSALLNEIAWGDRLLIDLPRVQPGPELRARIFHSPEFQEILAQVAAPGMTDPGSDLMADPGPQGPGHGWGQAAAVRQRRRWGMRVVQMAAAVVVLVGATMLVRQGLMMRSPGLQSAGGNGVVPAGQVRGPIPSGARFIYSSGGQLWSHPEAAGGASMALTPQGNAVANGWAVSPAGDRVAYIDQVAGALHVVQADSQNDQVIVARMAHPGAHPQSYWASAEGRAILRGLAWSPDGQRLAFIGDPSGSGSTAVYVVNADGTGLRRINENSGGITQAPVWSPLGVRMAYEQTSGGATSIWEYNFVAQETLEVAQQANPAGAASDVVHTLAWNSDTGHPALTWSAGPADGAGSDSLWVRRVGVNDGSDVALAQGELRFADYSAAAGSDGAWVYAVSDGLDEVSLAGYTVALAGDPGVVAAAWSSDGTRVAYVDEQGALQMQTLAGANVTIAQGVTSSVAPVWSPDGRQIAFVANGKLVVARATGGDTRTVGALSPGVRALSWSPDGASIVATGAGDIAVAAASGGVAGVPAASGVERVAWTDIS
jgi:hypothetical protein